VVLRCFSTAPFIDGQIAAIASVNDLVLVTANKADLRGFRGLRVQSWA
jgi:tRNA(fMet)-specific endonuclease VapC